MGNLQSMQSFPDHAGKELQKDVNNVTPLRKSPTSSPKPNSPKTTVKDVINHVKSMPNNTINNALYGLLVNKSPMVENMEGKSSSRSTSPPEKCSKTLNHHEKDISDCAVKRNENASPLVQGGPVGSGVGGNVTPPQNCRRTMSPSKEEDHVLSVNSSNSQPGCGQTEKMSNSTASSSSQKQDVEGKQPSSSSTSSSSSCSAPVVAFNPKKRFMQRYGGPDSGAVAPPVAPSATTENTDGVMKPETTTSSQTPVSTSATSPFVRTQGEHSMVSMRSYLDEMMAEMVRTPLNELENHQPPSSATIKTTSVPNVSVKDDTPPSVSGQSTMTQYDLIQQKIRQMLQDEDCGAMPKKQKAPADVPRMAPAPEDQSRKSAPSPAITPLTLISAQIEAVMRQQPVDADPSPGKPTTRPTTNSSKLSGSASSSLQDGKESSSGKSGGVLVHGYPQLRSHLLGSITKGTPRSKPPMDEVVLAEKRAPKDTVYSIITNEIKQRVFSSNSGGVDSNREGASNSTGTFSVLSSLQPPHSGTTSSSLDARRNTWSFPNRAAAVHTGSSTLRENGSSQKTHPVGNSPHRPIVIDPPASHPNVLPPQVMLERPASYHGNQTLDGGQKPGSPQTARSASFSKSLRDAYLGIRENKFVPGGASPNSSRHPNPPHEELRHRLHTTVASSSSGLRPPLVSPSPHRPIPSPQHPHRYTPYPTISSSSSKAEPHFPRAVSVDKPGQGKKSATYGAGGHLLSRESSGYHSNQGTPVVLPSPRSLPSSHQSEAGRRSHGLYEKQGYPQQSGEEHAQKNVIFQQGPSDLIGAPRLFTGSITAGTPRSAGPLLVEKQRELLSEAYEIQSRMSPPRHHQTVPQAKHLAQPTRHEFEKEYEVKESHSKFHLQPSPASYAYSPQPQAPPPQPTSQSGVVYHLESGHIPKPSLPIGPGPVGAPVTAPPPLMSLKDVAPNMVRDGGLPHHTTSKPDLASYRARSRSPVDRDRAQYDVDQSTRLSRGSRGSGDLPLDLSSKKSEPVASALSPSRRIPTPLHHPAQQVVRPFSPLTGLAKMSRTGAENGAAARDPVAPPPGSSIYQEEWLRNYRLPPEVEKLPRAERSQIGHLEPPEPQIPHVIVPVSHDSGKPSDPAHQPTIDIGLLPPGTTPDYLVAQAQMAYASGTAMPYGFIYPMAFGLKPGFMGCLTTPDTSFATATSTTKQQLVTQPVAVVKEQIQEETLSKPLHAATAVKPVEKMRNLGPNLLGDHPADDVLSLNCVLCGAGYGNVHSFIRHFHRDHGTEGEPQRHHVNIKSILKAKQEKEIEGRALLHEQYKHSDTAVGSHMIRTPHHTHLDSSAQKQTPPPPRKDVMNCLYCNQEFPTRDWGLFRKHMRSHEHHSEHAAPMLQRCSECRVEFKDAAEHQFHASLCHKNRSCMCRVCSEGFNSVDAMYRHIHTVHKGLSLVEVEYCCLDCNESYAMEKELFIHWQQVHHQQHQFQNPGGSPGAHITLAIRTRVKDQGVAMSPPNAVHRVTPDTTCKEESRSELSEVKTSPASSVRQEVTQMKRDSTGYLSKGTYQDRLHSLHPKEKTLTYLEFLEQKVEEEHLKQSDAKKSLISPRIGEDVTNLQPVGHPFQNKRHVEDQHVEPPCGRKLQRLEHHHENREHNAMEMTTVDSKITEIITNTLSEKKDRMDAASGDFDGKEETSMKNENLAMRALMTSIITKESMQRILHALHEQEQDKSMPSSAAAASGEGGNAMGDNCEILSLPSQHHQSQNHTGISDSDILDATVLAGISGAQKLLNRSFSSEISGQDTSSEVNNGCPPKLESLLLENTSRIPTHLSMSASSGSKTGTSEQPPFSSNTSISDSEADAPMPVLEPEQPTAGAISATDASSASDTESLHSDANRVIEKAVEKNNTDMNNQTEMTDGVGDKDRKVEDGSQTSKILERVDSFEERPLVIDMDDGGSVKNDSSSEDEDTE